MGETFDPKKFEEQMKAWGEQIGAELGKMLNPLTLQMNASAVISSLLQNNVDEAERILRDDIATEDLTRVAFVSEAMAHICTEIFEERNS